MSRTSLLSSHLLRATAVLALALSLGACSRSQNASEALTGPGREGAGTRVVAGCPTLLPNTAAAPSEFAMELASVPQFRSNRLRIELVGDIADSVNIGAMGACATADVPSILFQGGHVNVFLAGTNTSVSGPLTFGQLLFPGALLEPGVVVAQDANRNVYEIIWPELAGTGIGAPIVRVQLARTLVNVPAGARLDVQWDMVVQQDANQHFISGRTNSIPTDGSAIIGNAPAPAPCPATLGAGGLVVNQIATVASFTRTRFRAEITGDVAAGTIGLSGACAAADAPTISFTGGTANVRLAGTNTSLTASGSALTFGALLFPGIALEPGVVVANDASRNVLEIIWPSLAGTGTGAPILRLQLASWARRLVSGARVDVDMTFNARGADGLPATFTARATRLQVPNQR